MTAKPIPRSQPRRRRRLARIILATTSATALIAFALLAPEGAIPLLRRSLSESLPDGGCFVTPSVAAPPDVHPAFAASYPGSGARMTWNLVEALTGIVTGDDWNSNGRGRAVVTVKTHHPHPHGREVDWSDEVDRAFVVVRDPLSAIPSFHNFLYERLRGLENHSTRAPVDVWLNWRDNHFHEELDRWARHLEHWIDNYDVRHRIVISYEDLTDDDRGPSAARELNRFLGEGPGVDPIADESVECVWRTVVKYKNPRKEGEVRNTRRALPKDVRYVGNNPLVPGSNRSGDKTRDYTPNQLREALEVVRGLMRKYGDEADEEREVRSILGGYERDVKSRLEKAEGDAAAAAAAAAGWVESK